MNRIFRIIWSQTLSTWVVVSELATRRGKKAVGVDERAAPPASTLDRDVVEGAPPTTAWLLRLAMSLALRPRASARVALRAGLLAALFAAVIASAQATDYYWDTNSNTTGSGGPTPIGVWSATDLTLTTDANGNLVVVPVTTTTADRLYFSAGTDATGSYTVNVSGTQNIGRLTFQEGNVLLTGGTINFGAVAGQIDADTTTDTIASVITGTNGFTIAGGPTTSLRLTGTNTFTGIVRIGSNVTLAAAGGNALSSNQVQFGAATGSVTGGNLTLGAANQINDTAVVAMNNGTTASSFSLNGFNETIAGITMNNGVFAAGTTTIRNGAATDATLTLVGSGSYNAGLGSTTTGRSITDGGAGKLNIVLAGTGTQYFTGTEATYTGTTTINSGILRLANTSTWASNITLNGGTLYLDQSSTGTTAYAGAAVRTHANTIGGTGGTLLKASDGTVILSGVNTYQGATRISVGTLQAGSTSAFGINSAVSFSNLAGVNLNLNGFSNSIGSLFGGGLAGGNVLLGSATLTTGGNNTSTVYAGAISGTGNLVKNGTGTQTLTGVNTYTGTTTINGGTLRLGIVTNNTPVSDGTTGALGTGAVSLGAAGTLAFNRVNAYTVANTISGAGTLAQIGTGTTMLTSDSTYTGGTTISAGTLQLGNGGTTGSIVGDVTDNAALVFDRSDAITFGGIISGTGAVTQLGPNTLTLTGDSTYTGNTTISAGTLQLGNGGTTGSIVGDVADNGALVFNRSNAVTYGGAISGAGTLTQIGTGVTTLTGNSSAFSGSTSVTNGSLWVNGTLGSAGSTLTVASGGTLGGTGTVGGSVAISDGVLAPGNATPGTLTVNGDLSLASASVLNYDFGQAGVVGGPLNDLTVVGGNLTLDGTLNVAVPSGGTYGPGLYRVISYGGTLTNNGLVLGAQPAGSTNLVQTAVAGQVNLINTAGLTLNFWDGGTAPRNNSVIDGGNGVWQASAGNDNWTESTGAINAPYTDGTFAIFAGSPGTVTVDNSLGAVVSGGMQFATSGYVVQGQPITLAAGSNTLRVGDGTAPGAGYVATIASELAGTGGIDKTDLGTLVLTGTNSYTGGTTITAGTLQLGNGGITGSIVGDVTDNGTLAFDRSDTLTYGGVISGSGAVNQVGTGTTVLTGTNTYTGGTAINAGVLQAGAAASGQAFGNLSAVTLADVAGATLDLNSFNQTIGSLAGGGTTGGNVTLGSATLTTGGNNSSTAYAGVISGTGGVTKTGTGTQSLTGNSTYTGGTTISAGTLQLGNGGTTGSIVGDVTNNAALTFDRSDILTYGGVISGTGVVNQIGTGTTMLTSDSTYTGGTTISAGTLQLGNGGTTGSIVGDVTDNAALVFDRSDAITFGGIISGTGAVTQLGPNTLTLTGDSTYTGNTTISAGTLQLGNGGTTGSIVGDVADNGALVFNRSNAVTYGGAISGAGTLTQIGTGVTTLTGNSSAFSGSTSVTNGSLWVNGTLGSAGSTLTVASGGTLGGTGTVGGSVAISDGVLAPGNATPGTLTVNGDLSLASASVLNYDFGQAGVVGGPLNDLTVVGGNLTLDGTLNVAVPSGGTYGPGLYRVISYGGTLTNNGLVLGAQPAGSTNLVQTAVAGQVNLINTAGLTLNFWDGGTAPRNNSVIDGGNGVWQASAGNDNWTESTGAINAPYTDGTFAIFAGSPGTVTVDNSLGAVVSGGMQFATSGYVVQGQPITLAAGSNTLRVGDGTAPGAGYVATIASELAGTGGIDKTDLGTLVLTGTNSYTGGTTITAGTLQLGNGGITSSVVGNIIDNGTLAFDRSDDLIYGNTISGTGAVTKLGTNTLTLSSESTYTGTTTVTAGTLRAGAASTFNAMSAHTVAQGATLDANGFDQSVAALTNSGMVNLTSTAAGSTLTVTGVYTGNGGTLRLGTALAGSSSVSDRLVLNGPTASASGNTTIQLANLGGLGALTTGDGIELVGALNGATTTAQTSKDAFSLAGGHVDAGAFEYRLYAADAQGAGENWYLRSTAISTQQPVPPSQPPIMVPTYRAEVPLLAALPAQLRRADFAMLGNLHQRMGEEAPATSANAVDANEHRTWVRVVYADVGLKQPGIAQVQTDGSVSGLQIGTDLWVKDAWHAGFYAGYLNGSADVTGNARGLVAPIGSNHMSARYLGAYATWMDSSGWYVDGVLQGASQRYDVRSDINPGVSGKGDSFMASLEAGKSYALAGHWSIEPQMQVVYQHNSVDDVTLSGARVQQDAASGWTARLGVRVKEDLAMGAGLLQPYGRVNVYRSNVGDDVANFVGPAGTTAIRSGSDYSAGEAAAGMTLTLTREASLYGEAGYLWNIGGDARVKSSMQASFGVKVRW